MSLPQKIILKNDVNIEFLKKCLNIILCKDVISIIISYYNSSRKWTYGCSESLDGDHYIIFNNNVIKVWHNENPEIRINRNNDIVGRVDLFTRYYCDAPYIFIITDYINVVHYYNKSVSKLTICSNNMKNVIQNIICIKNSIIYTRNLDTEYTIISEDDGIKYSSKNINLSHIITCHVNKNNEIVLVVSGEKYKPDEIFKIKLEDETESWCIRTGILSTILYNDDYNIIYRRHTGLGCKMICFDKFSGKISKLHDFSGKIIYDTISDNDTLFVVNKNPYSICMYRLDV